MKKLMIAAAIVCAATMVQASAFKWQTIATGTSGVIWDGTTSKNAYASYGAVTVYLFDAATYDQATAFKDLVDGKLNTAKAIDNTTLSTASKIAGKQFNYGESGNYYDFYFATVFDSDPNTFYISSLKEDQGAQPSSTTTVTWNDVAGNSKTTLDASAGFKGAGVYSAVPEPTSGLLLLLGVAGLALKRRRA